MITEAGLGYGIYLDGFASLRGIRLATDPLLAGGRLSADKPVDAFKPENGYRVTPAKTPGSMSVFSRRRARRATNQQSNND
jgi:hypothetical protein